MQLTSQLVVKSPERTSQAKRAALVYPGRLLRTAVPGDLIHAASGRMYRVVAKQASATGIRLRIADQDGVLRTVGLTQLAALYPCSPAVLKFASLFQKFAYDESLGYYVTNAIERAKLPLDPKIDWGKWLTAVYRPALRPLTKDESLIDDAIRHVVIQELYEREILRGFNPERGAAHQSEAVQVTTFLAFKFKKRITEAQNFVRHMKGVGSQGEIGRQDTDSLSYTNEYGEDKQYDLPSPELLPDDSERLDAEEVYRFISAFKDWIELHNDRKTTVVALKWITDRVVEGYSRKEMRAELADSTEILNRDGQPYNVESFKKLVTQWVGQILTFCGSKENPYRETAVSKKISERAEAMAERKRAGYRGLVLALQYDQNNPVQNQDMPQQPYGTMTAPTAVVEPAKPAPQNPNVQQQQDAAQSNQMKQQQQQNLGPGNQDFQKPQSRVTIPPEIPGVNHA